MKKIKFDANKFDIGPIDLRAIVLNGKLIKTSKKGNAKVAFDKEGELILKKIK